jgi:hypothetical protein
MEVSGQLHTRPGRFTPREWAPGTHWIGSLVGPRAVLDAVVKRKIPSPLWESNPRTPIVQPVRQSSSYHRMKCIFLDKFWQSAVIFFPFIVGCETWFFRGVTTQKTPIWILFFFFSNMGMTLRAPCHVKRFLITGSSCCIFTSLKGWNSKGSSVYFNIPVAGLTLSWNVHPKLCGRDEPEHVTLWGSDEWGRFEQLPHVPPAT